MWDLLSFLVNIYIVFYGPYQPPPLCPIQKTELDYTRSLNGGYLYFCLLWRILGKQKNIVEIRIYDAGIIRPSQLRSIILLYFW